MLALLRQLDKDNIRFVRFEASDCNGTNIGKLVPIKSAKEFIKNGMGLPELFWFCTNNNNAALEDMRATKFRNAKCKVYPDTYTIIPWSNSKMASISIYPTINNNILHIDPRTIALTQLKKLKSKYNIDLLSSFEHEFHLLNPKTSLPFNFEQLIYFSPSGLTQFEDFFIKLSDNFEQMGINIEAMHPEFGKGMYEITTKPNWNIFAADNAHMLKIGVREMAMLNKLKATFVSMPFIYDKNYDTLYKGSCAGAHFNMSLWANKSKNLLYDKSKISDGLDGLSDIGRYWIGGILHHIPGLTLFCSPTSNCFERLKLGWKKEMNDLYGTWGRNDRERKIRLKMDKESSYMEFRMPSSLSNPYIVVASVVIAGMDGIENKIEPPNEICSIELNGYSEQFKNENFTKIPIDMHNALNAMIEDKVLCDGFGDEFMIHFVKMKRVEIEDYETLKMDKKHPALFSKL
eukprot:339969_1